MTGKPLRLICVGKLKQSFIQEGVSFYQKRLKPWRKLEVVEVRDGEGDIMTRKDKEAILLKKALHPKDLPIVLDMGGKHMTSEDLALMLKTYDATAYNSLSFVLGGPYGLAADIIKAAQEIISLSHLTFTHEMARLILCEQLYRATCILQHIPYHH
ncbi:MAG: 23S rRNA (pseudouridine(1915)-N(3))-methyltransferase RlmH [Desulfovibrionaceae bacterium]|nr:23S rRNA (pseudouridine(1915)-N(3))-methyltransferase RlmH [Desulfovibrionaceae bacterium]